MLRLRFVLMYLASIGEALPLILAEARLLIDTKYRVRKLDLLGRPR